MLARLQGCFQEALPGQKASFSSGKPHWALGAVWGPEGCAGAGLPGYPAG